MQVDRDGAVWETFGYDGNSNRTWWTGPWGAGMATYDAQDRLLTYGGKTYTYTANGELATKSDGAATVRYTYDVMGNLRRVQLPDGVVIDYVIDAANRRIGKQINGALVKGFLYGAGASPVAELDTSGNVVSTFIYATGGNVPNAMVRGGATYRIVTDHLGSVRWVLDAQTGAVAQRIDYDPFGRVTLDTNPSFQPFGFAGGLYDYQTGLVRFGARDYDAETGRWTSKDPIGFAGGDTNLYGYVVADPINGIDPDGLRMAYADPGASWWDKLGIDRVAIADSYLAWGEGNKRAWKAFVMGKTGLTSAEFDALAENFWFSLGFAMPAGRATGANLRPYGGRGGGHHVPAKSAFTGSIGYDVNAALAIPNAELLRLGVSHSAVTGAQMTGYRAFAQAGGPLTWEAVATIETNALVRGGMAPEMAGATVSQAIQALRQAGVPGPTRIPWGG